MTKITIKEPTPKPTTRPLNFLDLRKGDIFQFKYKENNYWEHDSFLMVNPLLKVSGQCFNLNDGGPSWFYTGTNDSVQFRVLRQMELSDIVDSIPL